MASLSVIQRELRNVMSKMQNSHEAPLRPIEDTRPQVREAVTKFVSGFRVSQVRLGKDIKISNRLDYDKAIGLQHGGAWREEMSAELSSCVDMTNHRLPMLEPLGEVKVAWDTAMVAVVIATIIVTPFQLSFTPRDKCDNPFDDGIEWFNLMLDFLLFMDCVITFRTAVYTNGAEISRDYRVIAKKYFKGWFGLDLIASIPFNHIIYSTHNGCNGGGSVIVLFKTLKVIKTFRLLRIFRLLKLMRQMDQWQSSPSNSTRADFIRFGRLVLIIIIMAHLGACALMYLADPHRPNVLESKNRSWVTEFVTEKCNALNRDDWRQDADIGKCAEPSTARLYIAALYWSATTLTTVGYGDITPFTTEEMVWSIVIQFIGTCSLGYILGEVTSILTHDDKSSEMIREKISAINEYMKYRKLPSSLRARIRSHYTHLWKRTTVWDEPQILDEMSAILRSEVMQYVNNEKLKGMRFMTHLGNISDEAMCQLSLRLTPQMASTGEPIIKEHQFGQDTYILSNGHAEMHFHDQNISSTLECSADILVKHVETGDFFSEYTLFLTHEVKHPFTVRAIVPCELFSINRDALNKISERFPATELHFAKLVNDRFHLMMNLLTKPKNMTYLHKDTPERLQSKLRTFSRRATSFFSNSTKVTPSKVTSDDEEDDDDNSPNTLSRRALAYSVVERLQPYILVKIKLWAKRAALASIHNARIGFDGFPMSAEGPVTRAINSRSILPALRYCSKRALMLEKSGSMPDAAPTKKIDRRKDKTQYPCAQPNEKCTPEPPHSDNENFSLLKNEVYAIKDSMANLQHQLELISKALSAPISAATTSKESPRPSTQPLYKQSSSEDQDVNIEDIQ